MSDKFYYVDDDMQIHIREGLEKENGKWRERLSFAIQDAVERENARHLHRSGKLFTMLRNAIVTQTEA